MTQQCIGILACIALLVLIPFTGCLGTTASGDDDRIVQTPVTVSALPVTVNHPSATYQETAGPAGTIREPSSPDPAGPNRSFRPGLTMRADDFFRQYLDGILFIRNRQLEYRYKYDQEYFNETWLNASWTYTFQAAGRPGTWQGTPAIQYSETIISPYRDYESPLPAQRIDLYYDKDTGITIGEKVTINHGNESPEETTISPGGSNLSDSSNFYVIYSNDDRFLVPGMIGAPGIAIPGDAAIVFVGNETITVPAGTFDQASHFTEHHISCGFGGECSNNTEDFWAVPGVPGFVRIRYESEGPGPVFAGSIAIDRHLAELSRQVEL